MIQKTFQQLNYYEISNHRPPLVLLHAQGTDSTSFARATKALSKGFHIYCVDCYGHGGSLHDPAQYNIRSIASAVAAFIQGVVGEPVWLLGHSSGGLIAAYIAAETDLCEALILEDPPFFSCQGERRKTTFNYADLSTICRRYNAGGEGGDFVLYYFAHQYAWNFFPEKSREKIRGWMVERARAYRRRHPEKNLKVPLWPRAALAGFVGMNRYDPRFGETFYDDSFHCGIPHGDILKKIRCRTLFLKAKTMIRPDGLLMAALSEEDVERVAALIADCKILRFDCGHGIHVEKEREFIRALLQFQEEL